MRYKRSLLATALVAVLVAPSVVRGQENKAVARRYLEEVVSKGNLAVVDELVATNYVGHSTVAPEVKGPEGLKQRITQLRTAFPDIKFTIDDLVAEGDKVATRTTFRGTHKGDFMGVAPTGKAVTVTGIGILHIANGKIQEGWLNTDLMHQLSAGPKMGPASK